MAEEKQQGRVIVQHEGRRIEIPTGREIVHADQLEVMLESMLESIEGRYATKQEVVNAVNAIMRIHLTRLHTPWYRRLLAWALEPLFARRALEQQDPRRAPVPDALELEEEAERASQALDNARVTYAEDPAIEGTKVGVGATSVLHTAAPHGMDECRRCGEYHLEDEIEALNAAVRTQWDREEARETFHEEAAPAPELETLDNGVKFRNRRKVRD